MIREKNNQFSPKKNMSWHMVFFLLLFEVIFSVHSIAQLQAKGGGEYHLPQKPCLSPEQYKNIFADLAQSERLLNVQGKLPPSYRTSQVLFSIPLRQAAGFNYPSYYGISNNVDQNQNDANQFSDYNCSNRTYDNHRGTDYFLWPFDNLMQERNQVEVIAAADGIIISKIDGNFDQNCSFCTNCQWNAVYLRHADGSTTWYGHLKKNTVTSKAVGMAVQRGEYLGVVGSSGYSSGPHLHFEVYRSNIYSFSNLIDPYAGTCNQLNGSASWWDKQSEYFEPRIALIQIQSAHTDFKSCPVPEMNYEVKEVLPDQTVYFYAYFFDQMPGTTVEYQILRPDGTIFLSLTDNITTYYRASWRWLAYTFPMIIPSGEWVFRATYAGKTVNYPFRVSVAANLRNEISTQFARIYPNPFGSELLIEFERPLRQGYIRITDVTGKLLLAKQIPQNADRRIRLQDIRLSKGIYRLTIEDNGRIIAAKMLLSSGQTIE